LIEPLEGNRLVLRTVIEVAPDVAVALRFVRAESVIRNSESSVSVCAGQRTVPGVPWAAAVSSEQ